MKFNPFDSEDLYIPDDADIDLTEATQADPPRASSIANNINTSVSTRGLSPAPASPTDSPLQRMPSYDESLRLTDNRELSNRSSVDLDDLSSEQSRAFQVLNPPETHSTPVDVEEYLHLNDSPPAPPQWTPVQSGMTSRRGRHVRRVKWRYDCGEWPYWGRRDANVDPVDMYGLDWFQGRRRSIRLMVTANKDAKVASAHMYGTDWSQGCRRSSRLKITE